MSRPRAPRCADHLAAESSICARCAACCALRGREPTPYTSGPSGGQRGHPERAKRRAELAQGEEVKVRLTRAEIALLDAQRGAQTRAEYLGALLRGEAQAAVSAIYLEEMARVHGVLGPWEPDGEGWVRRWVRLPSGEAPEPSRVYPVDGEWAWKTHLDGDDADTLEGARDWADTRTGYAVLLAGSGSRWGATSSTSTE